MSKMCLNLLLVFLTVVKINITFVIMVIFGERNHSLSVILIKYMKLFKYIHFLPPHLKFCDHSKCILLD